MKIEIKLTDISKDEILKLREGSRLVDLPVRVQEVFQVLSLSDSEINLVCEQGGVFCIDGLKFDTDSHYK